MYKQFDPKLYDADDNAKEQVIRWLEMRGNQAWVNPDTYGIDLLCLAGNTIYGVEVEVKHNWSGANFPFAEVHWPIRKIKFAEQGNSWFFMLNNERTHMAVANGELLLSSPIIQKQTKYTDLESFVAVPLNQVVIYKV